MEDNGGHNTSPAKLSSTGFSSLVPCRSLVLSCTMAISQLQLSLHETGGKTMEHLKVRLIILSPTQGLKVQVPVYITFTARTTTGIPARGTALILFCCKLHQVLCNEFYTKCCSLNTEFYTKCFATSTLDD